MFAGCCRVSSFQPEFFNSTDLSSSQTEETDSTATAASALLESVPSDYEFVKQIADRTFSDSPFFQDNELFNSNAPSLALPPLWIGNANLINWLLVSEGLHFPELFQRTARNIEHIIGHHAPLIPLHALRRGSTLLRTSTNLSTRDAVDLASFLKILLCSCSETTFRLAEISETDISHLDESLENKTFESDAEGPRHGSCTIDGSDLHQGAKLLSFSYDTLLPDYLTLMQFLLCDLLCLPIFNGNLCTPKEDKSSLYAFVDCNSLLMLRGNLDSMTTTLSENSTVTDGDSINSTRTNAISPRNIQRLIKFMRAYSSASPGRIVFSTLPSGVRRVFCILASITYCMLGFVATSLQQTNVQIMLRELLPFCDQNTLQLSDTAFGDSNDMFNNSVRIISTAARRLFSLSLTSIIADASLACNTAEPEEQPSKASKRKNSLIIMMNARCASDEDTIALYIAGKIQSSIYEGIYGAFMYQEKAGRNLTNTVNEISLSKDNLELLHTVSEYFCTECADIRLIDALRIYHSGRILRALLRQLDFANVDIQLRSNTVDNRTPYVKEIFTRIVHEIVLQMSTEDTEREITVDALMFQNTASTSTSSIAAVINQGLSSVSLRVNIVTQTFVDIISFLSSKLLSFSVSFMQNQEGLKLLLWMHMIIDTTVLEMRQTPLAAERLEQLPIPNYRMLIILSMLLHISRIFHTEHSAVDTNSLLQGLDSLDDLVDIYLATYIPILETCELLRSNVEQSLVFSNRIVCQDKNLTENTTVDKNAHSPIDALSSSSFASALNDAYSRQFAALPWHSNAGALLDDSFATCSSKYDEPAGDIEISAESFISTLPLMYPLIVVLSYYISFIITSSCCGHEQKCVPNTWDISSYICVLQRTKKTRAFLLSIVSLHSAALIDKGLIIEDAAPIITSLLNDAFCYSIIDRRILYEYASRTMKLLIVSAAKMPVHSSTDELTLSLSKAAESLLNSESSKEYEFSDVARWRDIRLSVEKLSSVTLQSSSLFADVIDLLKPLVRSLFDASYTNSVTASDMNMLIKDFCSFHLTFFFKYVSIFSTYGYREIRSTKKHAKTQDTPGLPELTNPLLFPYYALSYLRTPCLIRLLSVPPGYEAKKIRSLALKADSSIHDIMVREMENLRTDNKMSRFLIYTSPDLGRYFVSGKANSSIRRLATITNYGKTTKTSSQYTLHQVTTNRYPVASADIELNIERFLPLRSPSTSPSSSLSIDNLSDPVFSFDYLQNLYSCICLRTNALCFLPNKIDGIFTAISEQSDGTNLDESTRDVISSTRYSIMKRLDTIIDNMLCFLARFMCRFTCRMLFQAVYCPNTLQATFLLPLRLIENVLKDLCSKLHPLCFKKLLLHCAVELALAMKFILLDSGHRTRVFTAADAVVFNADLQSVRTILTTEEYFYSDEYRDYVFLMKKAESSDSSEDHILSLSEDEFCSIFGDAMQVIAAHNMDSFAIMAELQRIITPELARKLDTSSNVNKFRINGTNRYALLARVLSFRRYESVTVRAFLHGLKKLAMKR